MCFGFQRHASQFLALSAAALACWSAPLFTTPFLPAFRSANCQTCLFYSLLLLLPVRVCVFSSVSVALTVSTVIASCNCFITRNTTAAVRRANLNCYCDYSLYRLLSSRFLLRVVAGAANLWYELSVRNCRAGIAAKITTPAAVSNRRVFCFPRSSV